jgi:hypothetical protein
LLAESVRDVDVSITSSYVQATLPLARLTLRSGRSSTVILMYVHLISPFPRKLMHMDTGLPHPPEPIEFFSNISQSKVSTYRFRNHSDDINPGKISGEQNSYLLRRKNEPSLLRFAPPSGRDVEVSVTKTIEFGVELHLGEGTPTTPTKMGDEESGSYTPERPALEEQDRGIRILYK